MVFLLSLYPHQHSHQYVCKNLFFIRKWLRRFFMQAVQPPMCSASQVSLQKQDPMNDIALKVSLCALVCLATMVLLPPKLGCIVLVGTMGYVVCSHLFFLSKVSPISRASYLPCYDVPRTWRPITPLYHFTPYFPPTYRALPYRTSYPPSCPRMDVVAGMRHFPRVDVVGSRRSF